MDAEHVIHELQELLAAARGVQGLFALAADFTAGDVAAAVRGKSGRIYTGVCFDVSCGIGFCAEHAAIAEMLKHRESEIDCLVAVGDSQIIAPCGRCRELMAQINGKNLDARIILSEDRVMLLRELLPEHWLFSNADPGRRPDGDDPTIDSF